MTSASRSKKRWIRLSKVYLPYLNVSKEGTTLRDMDELITRALQTENLPCSDSESDISDQFEVFHKSSSLNRNLPANKNLTKHKVDVLIMDQFTAEYKKLMHTMRTEENIPKNILNESISEIENILKNPSKNSIKPLSAVIKHERDIVMTNISDDVLSRPSSPIFAAENASVLTLDYMSGIWRMMTADKDIDKSKAMFVSPFTFDYYDVNNGRTAPPPYLWKRDLVEENIEFSKEKCLEWLQNN